VAQASGALSACAPLFAALGDPTRMRLVARLCAGGPQSIARLTAGSDVTRQAVSKHLLVLAGAGLVRGIRQGRESRWALVPRQLEVARRYLELISERWTQRLEALERHLDSTAEPKPEGDPRLKNAAGCGALQPADARAPASPNTRTRQRKKLSAS
jgi:DNA-binding transcriptional ArsR family regulator